MKVLFLPGFLQNGKRLARDSKELTKALEQIGITVDYLDPPKKIQLKEQIGYSLGADETAANKKWQSVIDRDFNRCWWDFRRDDVYEGFDESVRHALEYIKKNGPYIGIMGFSQGSSMATILTNIIHGELARLPYFRFSVLFSGMAFTEPIDKNGRTQLYDIKDVEDYAAKVQLKPKFATYFTPPKDLPTKVIIVYGSYDPVLPPLRTQYLGHIYKDRGTQIEFHGGHNVPHDEKTIATIISLVSSAINDKASNL
jgi:predicted esterase